MKHYRRRVRALWCVACGLLLGWLAGCRPKQEPTSEQPAGTGPQAAELVPGTPYTPVSPRTEHLPPPPGWKPSGK